jgi:hypothetical protein
VEMRLAPHAAGGREQWGKNAMIDDWWWTKNECVLRVGLARDFDWRDRVLPPKRPNRKVTHTDPAAGFLPKASLSSFGHSNHFDWPRTLQPFERQQTFDDSLNSKSGSNLRLTPLLRRTKRHPPKRTSVLLHWAVRSGDGRAFLLVC